MSESSALGKTLRFLGILFMALTSGFTLLGGIGTSCVAINPTGFGEAMAKLAPFQWLYILFVLIGIALGAWGIRVTILLIKGARDSYRQALLVLIAGVLVGVIHIAVSRALRGKSMPVDAVVYTTLLTLILFLLFRIPRIWQSVDFTKGNVRANKPAGGAAAILLGLLTLTIPYTMAPTHTLDGTNYAAAFEAATTIVGLGLMLCGMGLSIGGYVRLNARKKRNAMKAASVVGKQGF